MASGSSGRSTAGSKGYDFGSDDVLCSYNDFSNQEASNGKRSDSAIGSGSGKDFRDSRMGRSTLNLYNQQEESFNPDILSTVERTMKKHSDNLLRFLEGISGRLAQLELYCYNLERSIGKPALHMLLISGHAARESVLPNKITRPPQPPVARWYGTRNLIDIDLESLKICKAPEAFGDATSQEIFWKVKNFHISIVFQARKE